MTTTPSTRELQGSAVPGVVSRALPWILTVGGLLGTAAAFVLMVEKIALLADPFYTPSCSLNTVLSCGPVMSSPQAEAFGFPNPIVGLVGFAVVTATGVALLGGARLPRWYWLGLQAGTTFGVAFVHWLIAQSLYEIIALCPYCMVVWAVTIPVFWYTTLHNLRDWNLPSPRLLSRTLQLLGRNHGVVLTAWYVVIAVAAVQAFWPR